MPKGYRYFPAVTQWRRRETLHRRIGPLSVGYPLLVRLMAFSGVVVLGVVVLGVVGGSRSDSTASTGHSPWKKPIVGLHATLRGRGGDNRVATAALARSASVTQLREDLSWATAEPERGVFDWALFDGVVLAAARRGLRVLPLLDDTPGWATDGDKDSLPNDRADFAAFAAAAARRYGPGGEYWTHRRQHRKLARYAPPVMEIFNEPYYHDVDPGDYARMVRDAAFAARMANPRVKFLAAAEPGEQWLDGVYKAVPDIFASYARGGGAVHAYGNNAPATTPSLYSIETRRVEITHAIMAEHGDGNVPVWITEVGWPTCPTPNMRCVSEGKQAKYLEAVFRLARTRWAQWLRAIFVYNLMDPSRGSPADREQWFGLIRPDGSPKPAWSVLKRATKR